MFFQQRMTLKRKANRDKNDLSLSLILCYKTLIRVHDVFQRRTYPGGLYSIE